MAILVGGLASFLLIQNLSYKIWSLIMEWLQQDKCSTCTKTQCEASTYKLVINKNLRYFHVAEDFYKVLYVYINSYQKEKNLNSSVKSLKTKFRYID